MAMLRMVTKIMTLDSSARQGHFQLALRRRRAASFSSPARRRKAGWVLFARIRRVLRKSAC